MEITRGKIEKAKKVVIYGPEGIGKSTFASHFPDPLFIDTEGSTDSMDVARLPRPTSWTLLLEEIDYIKKTPGVCRTLVIDTIDWAEQLCVEHICDKHNKSGIEDFGYGNGYVYTKEEFGRFLNRLTDVIEAGVNVVLTAHAQLRKFEQPDEMGAYDRWELKLGKKTQSQTSPLVKEWADMLLFCNYKTHTVAVDDKGKKKKAMGGGKRVMYTSHHPCWDAKNRYGLPDECDLDYSVIQGIIEKSGNAEKAKTKAEKPAEKSENPKPDFMNIPDGTPEQLEFDTSPSPQRPPEAEPDKPVPKGSAFHVDERIPKALRDLMEEKLVSEEEIQAVVADRGYYPRSTPILNYDPNFVSGVLVGAWGQVYSMIEKLRETYEIPFDEDKK
ncbi:MAG TPA: ATP-binding protein [Candidatus Mediterraneibacter intestinavium]|nr:ATP-binding protein [Candidatus Mediterraneibacter intestinavium]